MPDAIRFLKKEIKNHRVPVTLPGASGERHLNLILQTVKAVKRDVFLKTYAGSLTVTYEKLSEKLFGSEPQELTFGVLCDDQLQMVFAFCMDFAEYSQDKRCIQYRDIDDLLLEMVPGKPEPLKRILTQPFPPMRPFPRSRGGGGVLRYAILDKNEVAE